MPNSQLQPIYQPSRPPISRHSKPKKKVVESAEAKGFDPAIKAATNNATKKALKNGKNKNKVLKITVEVLELEIQKAKGKNTTAKIVKQKKKLDKAIKSDKAAAGQQSETVQVK